VSLWEWLFHRRQRDEDLEEEVRSHLRMAAQGHIEQGESAEQARVSAVREFGNVGLVKEVTRDMWGWGWLEQLMQDVHYGLRMMAKNRGFTAVAVITLALGIGVNTALFSLLHDTILEPLPISHPQELVQLTWFQRGNLGSNFNWPDYRPLLEPHPALPGLFAYLNREATVRLGETSERVHVNRFPALTSRRSVSKGLWGARSMPRTTGRGPQPQRCSATRIGSAGLRSILRSWARRSTSKIRR